MFETVGTVDEAVFREAASILLGKWRITLWTCLCLFTLSASVLLFFWRSYVFAVVYSAVTVALLLMMILCPRRIAKTKARQIRESGAEEIRYLSRFEDAGVYIENQTTGASGTIDYRVLRSLVRTKNLLVLKTEARQVVFVFRGQLGTDQEQELIAFLKQKYTKIKHWPR